MFASFDLILLNNRMGFVGEIFLGGCIEVISLHRLPRFLANILLSDAAGLVKLKSR